VVTTNKRVPCEASDSTSSRTPGRNGIRPSGHEVAHTLGLQPVELASQVCGFAALMTHTTQVALQPLPAARSREQLAVLDCAPSVWQATGREGRVERDAVTIALRVDQGAVDIEGDPRQPRH
jgi:hypothetical protein